MAHHDHAFRSFVTHLFRYLLFVRGALGGLLALLILGGFAISYLERLPLDESFYFTFITGLTIGYGDISPQTGWGRLVSVLIGINGMIVTGITVAVATRALADASRERMRHKS